MQRLLTAIAILAVTCAAWAAPNLKLIPQPQQVQVLDGNFDFAVDLNIKPATPSRKDDQFAARQLTDEIKLSLGVLVSGVERKQKVWIGSLADPEIASRIKGTDLAPLKDRGPEAYLLLVKPGEIIAAGNAPAGTFYAVQTLKQLLRANADGEKIPAVRILDWPGLQYRGYSDDISRGPIPTMDFFKRQIRTMAEFKMNMLTFYTEHVFKLDKHPVIAPPDGITAQQVKVLSAYARKYHVELVGNFQSFGHFAKILRHEEYANLRETGSVITPAKEESYKFLDDVYSEIAPAYGSKLFNVNCDETYGLGTGPSKALADKIGVGRVYLQHMNRIHDMLKDKYGKRMMMWGDIALRHPDIIGDLDQDTILLSWGYGAAANYDRAIEPFVKAGLEFMVCPGVSCWSRMFPVYTNAVVNIQNYVRDGAKFGAIGMLNTTWDDDGENLFHWNFYGTNWGAACAWRPAGSDLDAYNAAFAQVSYGAPDDKITRAINLLADCARNPLTRGNADSAFYVRPFGALATSYDAQMDQAMDLMQKTEGALRLIREARPHATIDAEDLDYLEFAASRLRYIGRARELQLGLSKEYTEAVAKYPDTKPARLSLSRACAAAGEIADTVAELQVEYRRLWLAENRPWWLDRMAGKYDGVLNDLRAHADQLNAAAAEFDKTGVPPDPREVKLELVETSRRNVLAVPAKDAILPAKTEWTVAAEARVPLRVENDKLERTDYLVEVKIDFGKIEVDPGAVQVVEYTADGKTQALTTQYDPKGEDGGHVVFVMPGKTAPEAKRTFAVYYGKGTFASRAKPGVTVKRDGPWYWVENSRYKILVGRHGAHLFEWYVKALNDIEITEPGRGGWSGFADAGRGSRDAQFSISVEAAGPVMVRLRCAAPAAAAEKLLTFYADEPYVEMMLANPVGFAWSYDRAENFAKDKGNPGTAFFSTGHKEPVCGSGEQVHAVARDATWGAKTRPDGLLLANITPEVKATQMTGPGGGWGGVGIEGSPPVSHFVILADKVEGDQPALLNAVQSSLDMRHQPRLRIGKAQTRPVK